MSVIPITIFFSLLLAGIFVLLFAREQRQRRHTSAERDSLLPLADETPRVVSRTAPICSHLEGGVAVPRLRLVNRGGSGDPDHLTIHDGHHDHHHDHDRACGCIDGSRPPCTGCLKRFAPAAPLS